MNVRTKSSIDFEQAYRNLNLRQREAVDTLEGPLLVIAGPGTGKTQILAIRIGNLLLRTDTDPKNILCLTYTDAGATEMRNRLIQFIGPTAYEVTINTFHAFCNSIIRDNPESFNPHSDFEVVSDLERNQLLLNILQNLDRGNVLYKYKGNYQYEIRNLLGFFEQIKKENWDPAIMLSDLDQYLNDMKTGDEFIYKRKLGAYKSGDFNEKKYETQSKRIERTKSAIRLYQQYQDALEAIERYEYEDMIQWVIRKFESDEELLAKYQERYQYVLVDEYQDTNGAQNRILFLLLSYFETANVFAVGDDDQAIYRFQGANVENMLDFSEKYHPKKIVLIDNYRSSQIILDTADVLISNNRERLVNKDSTLIKKLVASSEKQNYTLRPVFTEYPHFQAEILDVCKQIQSLLHQGVSPTQIAVLFRKNKDGENFIKWFEANGIPYQTRKQINVLDELLIQHLLNILRFITKEFRQAYDQDALLYKILHAPFIDIDAQTIGKLGFFQQEKKRSLDESKGESGLFDLLTLLGNDAELQKAGIKDTNACQDLHQKLSGFCKQVLDYTPQGIFEKILTELGILNFILSNAKKIEWLQIVNTFFEFLKEETRKKPLMSVIEFTDLLEEYQKNSISIPNMQFLGTRQGVNLSTIHSAKGLEYEYVFMINNSQSNWSGKTAPKYSLPPAYVNRDVNTEEDDRRLFYVGLTRAKLGIYISYHIADGKKDHTVSRFISEMLIHGLLDERRHFPQEGELIEKLLIDISPIKKNYELLEDHWFENFLQHFSLNPTALVKYLECPLSFYYENVLRVPGARTAALGFGNAVHFALESYFRNPLNLKQSNFDLIGKLFERGMDKFKSHFTSAEFKNYLEEGIKILPGFLRKHEEDWKRVQRTLLEQKITTEFESVPISGKLDRIDYTNQEIRVIDYKTGKPDPKKKIIAPSEDQPNGSSYWLQMVFYAILLRNQKSIPVPPSITSAIYFVNQTADKDYEKSEVQPDEKNIAFVENLIRTSYHKIKLKQFTPGCGKTTCDWCRYINSGVEISLSEIMEDEEREED